MKIELQNISKRYGNEIIIAHFSHLFSSPSATVLVGINGSGKSTLLQIISGFVSPSKGKIIFYDDEKILDEETRYKQVSFCAPYLELIEEMTLTEFLTYHFSFKKTKYTIEEIIVLIGLEKAKDKFISNFSSGMKQRVKLAQAIFANTTLLCLDEPCSNLDEQGIALFHDLIKNYCQHKITIVASNDVNEYSFCTEKINVIDFKN